MADPSLSTSEILAIERTKLANERTFLAYFRSFIVLLSSGLAILKIEGLHNIKNLGYFFVVSAGILFLLGRRYLATRKRLKVMLDGDL